ncbi:MAG: hypothetical protein HWE21_12605 [Cytophagia bacterium]|nr:hypothetical protein [Cytophagia bacterium]
MSTDERKLEIIRKVSSDIDEPTLDAIEYLLSTSSDIPEPILRIIEQAMAEEPLEEYTSAKDAIEKSKT